MPAQKALLQRIMDMRTHQTITEESPDYEPQANGLAEHCVQTIKGMVKTTWSALEGRIARAIPDDHPIFTLPIRHAACLHNRYHVGRDGQTP